MNQEQIYTNITMLTSQLVNNGMKPDDAIKEAENVVGKTLDAAKRLAEKIKA